MKKNSDPGWKKFGSGIREKHPRIRNTGLTDVSLDGADLLLGHGVPDPGHADHGAGVHDPVPEGVRVVPAHGVHAPIRRPMVRMRARVSQRDKQQCFLSTQFGPLFRGSVSF